MIYEVSLHIQVEADDADHARMKAQEKIKDDPSWLSVSPDEDIPF
jgi:hypothetical protein